MARALWAWSKIRPSLFQYWMPFKGYASFSEDVIYWNTFRNLIRIISKYLLLSDKIIWCKQSTKSFSIVIEHNFLSFARTNESCWCTTIFKLSLPRSKIKKKRNLVWNWDMNWLTNTGVNGLTSDVARRPFCYDFLI